MISPSIFDDQELLKRVAKGDERAFEIIYHNYSKKIYFFSLKTLQSPTLAEEVVQEVMLKLWRMGNLLTEINHLEGYLKTASRNTSLNLLRRQEIERRANDLVGISWEEANNETEELLLLNDTRRLLEVAIALLPPQQQEVYRLCHQRGLKYEEVAQKLNLAPTTVATHMKLALKFLRSYLVKHTDVAIMAILFKLF